MAVSDNRPFYLNLIKIRLPVPGFVSILHRISGLLMFLALPYSIYLLDLSLQGQSGFDQAAVQLQQPVIKLLTLAIVWSVIHHLLAGTRFLLTDFEIGLDKQQARFSSWLVLGLETIIFIWLAVEMML